MQCEVDRKRQMPRYPRARRHSPRKTPMMERFPRRTSGSDGTAGCHTQRRTFCLSCSRSRT